MRRVYLAGPCTGYPDFNYPAFNAEADRLRELGYHVENPAENEQQPTWQGYMRASITQMLTCDSVALLPGWAESKGALLERYIAQILGMAITDAARVIHPPLPHFSSDATSLKAAS